MCVKAVISGNIRKKEVNSEKYKQRKRIPQLQICFLLIDFFIRGSSGTVTLTPSDVAVLSGTNFSLRCSTDTTDDLLWYRLRPGAQSEDHIVTGRQVNDWFRMYYTVQYENQESNLTILAEQSTAARYACVEITTAERATAQVAVLESKPSCSGNWTGDILNLTCVVIFSGHGNPIVNWTQVSGKEEKEVTVGINNTKTTGPLTTLISTLTVRTNGSEFLVYSYRYMVKFCVPDNAQEMTNGQLCVFSQLLSIGENVTGTTSGIGDSSNASWWPFFMIPVVSISLIGVVLGIGCFLRTRAQRHKDQQTGAALVERRPLSV